MILSLSSFGDYCFSCIMYAIHPRRSKMTFQKLKVSMKVVKALSEMGIKEPTDIQQKAIPIIKSGKDIIGKSKTGSGKTAAFGIPLLDFVSPRAGVQALVLAPTRELAVQISREIEKFGKYLPVKIATIFGGMAIQPQVKDISKADIVVGTPGRILDHLQRGTLVLSKLTHFVLDEADRMVDMGFIKDIERIISYAPKKRQMILFGATISREIEYLERSYMNHPIVAEAESHVAEEYLEQYYYDVRQQEKFSLLVHLLKTEEMGQSIIFCSTRYNVERVSKNLRAQGIKSGMIHGKLTQNKRLRIIGEFNKGKTNILVASPVAARGLDIKNVSHVFNYDLSQDPQEYVHRVGRTARAGETGKAITLLGPRDYDVFNQILNNYSLNIQELHKGNFPRLKFDSSRDSRSGNRFGRSHRNHNSNGRRFRGDARNGRSSSRFSGHRGGRFSQRGNDIAIVN